MTITRDQLRTMNISGVTTGKRLAAGEAVWHGCADLDESASAIRSGNSGIGGGETDRARGYDIAISCLKIC